MVEALLPVTVSLHSIPLAPSPATPDPAWEEQQTNVLHLAEDNSGRPERKKHALVMFYGPCKSLGCSPRVKDGVRDLLGTWAAARFPALGHFYAVSRALVSFLAEVLQNPGPARLGSVLTIVLKPSASAYAWGLPCINDYSATSRPWTLSPLALSIPPAIDFTFEPWHLLAGNSARLIRPLCPCLPEHRQPPLPTTFLSGSRSHGVESCGGSSVTFELPTRIPILIKA